MPRLMLSELIEEVRACHAGRTDFTDARIIRVLNMATETIAKKYKPIELERHVEDPTVLAAETEELLFEDMDPIPRKIISVVLRPEDGRERKLIGLNERQFNQAFPKPDADAHQIPAVYVKFAQKIRFYPIPDLDYPIFISIERTPVTFTIDDLEAKSSLEAPDQATIFWAAAYLYFSNGEGEKGREYLNLFKTEAKEFELLYDRDEPDRLISSETARLTTFAGNSQPWNDPLIRRIR